MELWAEPGDVVIAVSSSGESRNIVSAVAAARRRGCRVLTLTGFKPGNRLRALGDINIYVPADTYGYVEMTHSVLCHCITDGMAARAAR
jgi:D-sedoheptulose 7-phosphate isomerase